MRFGWLAIVGVVAAGCAQGSVRGDGDAAVMEVDAPPQPIDAAVDGAIDAIDASTCVRAPCDIYAQCGCESMPGYVCDLDPDLFATGGTECRQDLLHGTETQACSRNSTCAALHSCIGARCRKYCMTDDDCPGAGGLCVIQPTAPGGAPIPGVRSCTTDCVPTQTANPTCPSTWACHVYLDDPTPASMGDERWLTDCAPPPASGGGVGAACTSHFSCAAGLDCVTLNPGGMQCRPNCMCPGGNCAQGLCAGGSGSCRGFTTPVVIGGVTYGVCF